MKSGLLFLLLSLNLGIANACSDIFINRGGYHVQARTMDFPLNVSVNNHAGFIKQENTTDIILNEKNIPKDRLTRWSNQYGFFGRAAFDTPKVVDGMNTQGFSIAMLYLPGTVYPQFNVTDKRPALSIYDLGSYLLGSASSVEEALKIIDQHQIVDAAIEAKPGIFLKDIPIHFVLRDSKGNSAVIEFIQGKTVVYPQAKNVLTNQPTYDWQLKHAALYQSLAPNSPMPNPKFVDTLFDYKTIEEASVGEATFLMGLPGDYTPASRFVRGTVLLNNLSQPYSSQEATYHAQSVLNALIEPPISDSFTLWSIIKDLDNQLIYIKDLGYFQGGKRFFPMSVTNGYTLYDLKAINFNQAPEDYISRTIQPTNPKAIHQLISAKDVPGF